LKELRARERDVRQLESKQDKTIVEHVHVLEEAKRVTDKELTRVQAELENRDATIRSLQTAKSKMQGEAEDLALKYGRELRSKEQDIKYYEKKVAETLVNVEKERRGKEEAELNTHRVQTELRQARLQGEELSERLAASEKSRRTIENELESLLDGPQVADLQSESSKSAGWQKEKERLETKIADLEREYEASTGAQTEQQSQIVSLQSQVRELRTVLDEAEVERTLLQKARRALRAELETIKSDQSSEGRVPGDPEYQKLQLRNQDLEQLVEEQEDRIAFANEKAKTVESSASNSQVELGKVRVENSKLGKVNVSCPLFAYLDH
jgi:myosin protein heavy chain